MGTIITAANALILALLMAEPAVVSPLGVASGVRQPSQQQVIRGSAASTAS
jgi:hypothetical protein